MTTNDDGARHVATQVGADVPDTEGASAAAGSAGAGQGAPPPAVGRWPGRCEACLRSLTPRMKLPPPGTPVAEVEVFSEFAILSLMRAGAELVREIRAKSPSKLDARHLMCIVDGVVRELHLTTTSVEERAAIARCLLPLAQIVLGPPGAGDIADREAELAPPAGAN